MEPNTEASINYPIVDITMLDDGAVTVPRKEYQKMAEDIVDALKTHGYAYLKSNYVTKATIEDMMSTAMRFFNLPPEVKLKYQMNGKSFEGKNGYMGIDFERLDMSYTGAFEFRESYNLYDLDIPLESDADCPGLQERYYSLYRRCKALTLEILRAIAVGLKLENENSFGPMFERTGTSDSMVNLRLLHYPPLNLDQDPDTLRCGAHADYSFITFNFQDEAGGLEYLDRTTGEWTPTPYIEGTVLIQTGLTAEKMTDGLFSGTYHQVKTVGGNKNVRRQSIAFFARPDNDIRLGNVLDYQRGKDVDEHKVTMKQFVKQLYEASFRDLKPQT